MEQETIERLWSRAKSPTDHQLHSCLDYNSEVFHHQREDIRVEEIGSVAMVEYLLTSTGFF